jgi:ABC-2 type transport system ATP-binding protein
MIAALKGKTTVFFSTHILNDVERVCDYVAVLDRGRIIKQAPIDEFKNQGGACRIMLEVTSDTEAFVEMLAGEAWASECHAEGALIHCVVSDLQVARERVPALVAQRGIGLVRLADEERTLEDVFVGMVGGDV